MTGRPSRATRLVAAKPSRLSATACGAVTPKPASSAAYPASRNPMPLTLTGSKVKRVTRGTTQPYTAQGTSSPRPLPISPTCTTLATCTSTESPRELATRPGLLAKSQPWAMSGASLGTFFPIQPLAVNPATIPRPVQASTVYRNHRTWLVSATGDTSQATPARAIRINSPVPRSSSTLVAARRVLPSAGPSAWWARYQVRTTSPPTEVGRTRLQNMPAAYQAPKRCTPARKSASSASCRQRMVLTNWAIRNTPTELQNAHGARCLMAWPSSAQFKRAARKPARATVPPTRISDFQRKRRFIF